MRTLILAAILLGCGPTPPPSARTYEVTARPVYNTWHDAPPLAGAWSVGDAAQGSRTLTPSVADVEITGPITDGWSTIRGTTNAPGWPAEYVVSAQFQRDSFSGTLWINEDFGPDEGAAIVFVAYVDGEVRS